jgi:hypothetical protein
VTGVVIGFNAMACATQLSLDDIEDDIEPVAFVVVHIMSSASMGPVPEE